MTELIADLTFEAIKVSMRQDKDGVLLVLRIHPNEVAPELLSAWVGSRFQVGMMALSDDDQHQRSPDQEETRKIIASAALLCKEGSFADFLEIRGYPPADKAREDTVATALCQAIGAGSRANLATDIIAKERFIALRKEYRSWLRN